MSNFPLFNKISSHLEFLITVWNHDVIYSKEQIGTVCDFDTVPEPHQNFAIRNNKKNVKCLVQFFRSGTSS